MKIGIRDGAKDKDVQKTFAAYRIRYGDGRVPVLDNMALLKHKEGSIYIVTGLNSPQFGGGPSGTGYLVMKSTDQVVGSISFGGPGRKKIGDFLQI
jgi:hypothetical protein